MIKTWLFTNEKCSELIRLTDFSNKKILTIAGAGDQGFSFLSEGAEKVDFCDKKQLAIFTLELKIACFKNLDYQGFKKFFEINSPQASIYRKSHLFHSESFRAIKFPKIYLPYLDKEEKYKKVQKSISKSKIFNLDLEETIDIIKEKFDLIYLSNILDHKKYCSNKEIMLKKIHQVLNSNGEFLLATQEKIKKIIQQIEKTNLFLITNKIESKPKFWHLLSPDYFFSFLLFKKI